MVNSVRTRQWIHLLPLVCAFVLVSNFPAARAQLSLSTGGDQLWWFGEANQAPPTYLTELTVTATGASCAGTYSWSIGGNTQALSFSPSQSVLSANMQSDVITVYAAGASTANNDVTVSASFTPQTECSCQSASGQVSIYVDSPFEVGESKSQIGSLGLTLGGQNQQCNAVGNGNGYTYGYTDLSTGNLYSRIAGAMMEGTSIAWGEALWNYETYVSTNWPAPNPAPGIPRASYIYDDVARCFPKGTPVTTSYQLNGGPLVGSTNQKWCIQATPTSQSYGVSDCLTGIAVTSDTSYVYTDEGYDTAVISPVN